MKPWKTIGTDGKFTLRQRGGEYLVQVDGHVLMNSRRHGSEEALARVGCARLIGPAPRVLVGGLGFGFTLRAALDLLPPAALVTASELSAAVAGWSRELVGGLTGHPLADPRVTVEVGDVQRLLARRRAAFDAILLDVDNGPYGVSTEDNLSLYGLVGLSLLRAALRPGGRLVIWSAGSQGGFLTQLREAGFRPSVDKPGDGAHLLFVGDAPGEAPRGARS
jgi:spermidine synthase